MQRWPEATDSFQAMWIKICGLKDTDTASQIAALRPDAVGLNFFAKSPRSVDVSTAESIVAALPHSVESVGLFVNHPLDDVLEITSRCAIGTAQLHGDEPPEFLAELKAKRPNLKLLRAFRVGDEGCGDVANYLTRCRDLNVCLAGCLIDARVEGAYGGTGHTAPWDLLADQYDAARWPRLIVAGGVTPGNVAEAIRITAPFGVDVASGVESAKAVKDIDLVKEFIAAARATESP